MPEISVIVPVYNTALYLAECLDSLIKQTFADIEIVCINDGSTDNSAEILTAYAERDKRIVVHAQKNAGLSAARNKGTSLAHGKYITFLDSDDFYTKDTLEKLYSLIANEPVDLVGFNAFPVYESKDLEVHFQSYKTYYDRKIEIKKPISGLAAMNLLNQESAYLPSACLFLYRKQFLEDNNIRFYEGIIHEDNLHTFQCFVLANSFLQDIGQYYGRRVREDSIMTQKKTYKNLRGYFLCLVNMLRSLSNVEMNQEEEDCVKAYLATIWQSVQNLHRSLDRSEILELLQCSKLEERVLFDLYLKTFSPQALQPATDIKVSVIVPIHNAERYIWDCLDSLLSQTLKDIEILCIDTGSTDSTVSILERYVKRDKRIKVICRNGLSLYELINVSIKNSSGKYLYFVDDSDFIDDTLIVNLYNHAEKLDADMVVSAFDLYDTNYHLCYSKKSNQDVDYISEDIENFAHLKESGINFSITDINNKLILRDYIIKQINIISPFSSNDTPAIVELFSNMQRIANFDWQQKAYHKRIKTKHLKYVNTLAHNDCPLISVVIPVYNAERFLWECLDSLRSQTLKEIEIICVDDGSTDSSMYVLQECQKLDSRIKIISQENQYAGAARNNGLEAAKGEYVIFLDADDFFDEDMLRSLYGRAKAYEADICVCKGQYFNQKTREITPMLLSCDISICPPGQAVFSKNDLINEIFLFTYPSPWTKLFRREFVQKYNLQFQNIRTANDLAFVMTALALAERITVLDQYLVYYRTGVATTLQATKLKEPLNFYNALMQLKENLIEHNLFDDLQIAFANLALEICYSNTRVYRNSQIITSPDIHRYVYKFLRNTGFYELGIMSLNKKQAYNQKKFDECNKIIQNNWEDYIKAEKLFQTKEIVKPTQKPKVNNDYYYQEIQRIYASKSFRIGRFVTYIPRKVRGGIRCYKEHGIGYTMRRVKEKFVGLLGGSKQ